MLPAPAPAAAAPAATDLTGLEQLRQRAAHADPGALKEAAAQFDALFIGMMLKSARAASLGKGIFDSEASNQYLELMDDQVALELARKGGLGFGKMLLEQISPRGVQQANALGGDGSPYTSSTQPPASFPARVPAWLRALSSGDSIEPLSDDGQTATVAAEGAPAADSAEQFVRRYLPDATKAARTLGIDPRLLLAQAALETGWGMSTPQHPDGRSANNLFGMKAGDGWGGARVAHWTMEHSGGVTARKREVFRAYDHAAQSFADYVDLIGGSPRYANALTHSGDPESYARAVAAAGYATDPDYASKWLSIYHGERLGDALRGLNSDALEPIW
jgi:peptidoglycan hydrolase FlgJ